MDTQKMIAEIKTTCTTLERRKEELMAKVKEIDDKLTAYRMAVESLEMTIPTQTPVENAGKDKPVGKLPEKFGRRTVLTLDGKSQTLIQWAKELHISPEGIQYRLTHGMSVKDALTKAKASYKESPKPQKVFAYDGHDNVIRQYVNIGEASRALNLPASTVEKIIAKMSKDDQLRVRNYYLAYVA